MMEVMIEMMESLRNAPKRAVVDGVGVRGRRIPITDLD